MRIGALFTCCLLASCAFEERGDWWHAPGVTAADDDPCELPCCVRGALDLPEFPASCWDADAGE